MHVDISSPSTANPKSNHYSTKLIGDMAQFLRQISLFLTVYNVQGFVIENLVSIVDWEMNRRILTNFFISHGLN